MLDKLLAFGSVFDWISPTVAAIHDHTKGPGVGFRVPVGEGWTGAQINALLDQGLISGPALPPAAHRNALPPSP